jgi:nicotinamide phosphoribosyltransferase
MSDAYKYSHFKQYPKGAAIVEVYLEARLPEGVSTFAGLQNLCQTYLEGSVFDEDDIIEAAMVCKNMDIPFNRHGWEDMLEKYNGRLPLAIWAVPEGSRIPNGQAQMIVTNTDPDFFWLPGFMETVVLRGIWYPTTVASTSKNIKDIIYRGLRMTADDPDAEIMFKLHDFGARGVSSHESAEIGGMAHLYNFYGSDTVEAVGAIYKTFPETKADDYEFIVAKSIPASEHSTVTSWGQENEEAAYRNLLETFPTGLVANVSDSYDIWNAITNIYGKGLRKLITERDGVFIVRPDSGDPVVTPVEVIKALMKEFGFTYNTRGYKVLPDYLRVLQGDGIGIEEVEKIIDLMIEERLSVSNIAFGMGGGLLQSVNRNVLDYACKCSALRVDEVWREVFKNPITDSKKKSKKGILRLTKTDGVYETVNMLDFDLNEWADIKDEMELTLDNGFLTRYTLEEVRDLANN